VTNRADPEVYVLVKYPNGRQRVWKFDPSACRFAFRGTDPLRMVPRDARDPAALDAELFNGGEVSNTDWHDKLSEDDHLLFTMWKLGLAK
jgi:hypothetical protein